MIVLDDVRRIFRRRPGQTAAKNNALGIAKPGATMEAKPLSRKQEVARSQEEVTRLVRRIGDHLDSQTDRADRLLTLLERLPAALDTLPEISRQNAQLIESINGHLEGARERDLTISRTLGQITETSGRQVELLEHVQSQLETNGGAAAQLNETLGGLHHALGDLAEANQTSTTVLARYADQSNEREVHLSHALSRSHRWTIVAVAASGAIALLAAGVATAALVGANGGWGNLKSLLNSIG